MGDQLLNDIIQLENRIQQQLQSEQERADQWLAGVRKEQQQRISQARQEAEAAEVQALEESRRRGEEQAAALLSREMDHCTRLEGIGDEKLLEVLRQKLSDILPEQVNDHQNGKS